MENQTHDNGENHSSEEPGSPVPAPTPEYAKDDDSDLDAQDETEIDTFPASDPQSSWAGPADPRDR